MSMTLNFARHLLTMGQNYQQLGRNHDALRYLSRLAKLHDLEPTIAEESQVRLAEIHLARRNFAKARRHLTAALTHQPANARYHHLMAAALAADEKADPQKAADHFRQSLKIDPDQPDCLGEFGLLALDIGQTEEGFQCLRRAVELSPDDPAVIGRLVEGLVREDRVQEARKALLAARFRNPRDGRFHKLWNDFQFQQLHQRQRRNRQDADRADQDASEPTLLPFIRLAPETVSPPRAGRIIRCDPPAPPAPPHNPRPGTVPKPRHA